jgi:predicted AAA+ superfamily ATPase
MISRLLEPIIEQRLGSGKAIVILGPRQTGKTTLLNKICQEKGLFLYLTCDDPEVRVQLENANEQRLRQIIGDHHTIFIDEAQRVKNIGLTLKLIIDRIPGIQLLVSGSSFLELTSEINEPLTGRKWEYMLLPISWKELVKHLGFLDARKQLETRLIYGLYPEVVNELGQETEILRQLASSYLYKDLLSYVGIRKPDLIEKLLVALALQLGHEVSYNELSQLLQVDRQTIMQYIDLLEKAFIVHRLQPFSRNLRNEISSSRKIYFYDNGIRNAILANFQPLALRQDTGALWENFLINERLKYLEYDRVAANRYFWRTYEQQEIDYLEERDGRFFAFEFKWNPSAKWRAPKSFLSAYPEAVTQVIHRDNFEAFIGIS